MEGETMKLRLALIALVAMVSLSATTLAAAAPAAEQATVGGTVGGPDGPIAGATITLEILGKGGLPRWVVALQAGPDGTWSYAGKAGDYRVTFEAAGFVPSTELLTMEHKGEYTLDVTLSAEAPPSGTIEGRITNDSGIGLHGFVYFYKQNSDGTWPGTYLVNVETAYDGTYSSGDLALGAYKVRLFTVHTGVQWYLYAPTIELATPVVLASDGQVATGIDAQFPPPTP
jgi:hypothetical protein